MRVAHGRRRVFLLESVEGGERLARYSFIGWDPFLTVRGKGERIILEEHGEARGRGALGKAAGACAELEDASGMAKLRHTRRGAVACLEVALS